MKASSQYDTITLVIVMSENFSCGKRIKELRLERAMSQEKLAEKANISRSLVSLIEAPGLAKSFSVEVLFDIADALDVDPAALINASVFPDNILNKSKN